jgi:hypothetical protein
MNRRFTVFIAALTVAALGVLPSQAAKPKPKPKPKPITVTYKLSLLPDPTPNVTGLVKDGCGVLPQSQDKHPFTVPAAGTLKIVLDSPDPTGSPVGGTDWDLYLLDDEGIRTSSTTEFSHEELAEPFKKKTDTTIWVCNLAGMPDGTVKYTFTYK